MSLTINPIFSSTQPTYFIADIAANHDGSLDRAIRLIELAAENGANAAKFQNFRAETIVSAQGFKDLGRKLSHQANWKKDVVEVYRNAELPVEWTKKLAEVCESNGIHYSTAPYDLDIIAQVSQYVPYFKVGSGDISWKESLEAMASYGKPVLLATGASEFWEVERALNLITGFGVPVVLMQCNTNYTGREDNFDFLNLLALNEYKTHFPSVTLGLSDHSKGHIAVLGAVALGARVIEKHFTDDIGREGPDHGFSLDPIAWRQMVEDTRILERSLGSGHKKVEMNEKEARVVQRRALRYRDDLTSGALIKKDDLIALRPCPDEGIDPFDTEAIVGKALKNSVSRDQLVRRIDFEEI